MATSLRGSRMRFASSRRARRITPARRAGWRVTVAGAVIGAILARRAFHGAGLPAPPMRVLTDPIPGVRGARGRC